jgi:hypothetical protein
LVRLKGKRILSCTLFVLLVLAFIVGCDPLGDYLIEITGATYHEGYIKIVLTPAYDGLRLSNFGPLKGSGDEEYEIVEVTVHKEGQYVFYILTLEEGAELVEENYVVRIEKKGFRFVYSDVLLGADLAYLTVGK